MLFTVVKVGFFYPSEKIILNQNSKSESLFLVFELFTISGSEWLEQDIKKYTIFNCRVTHKCAIVKKTNKLVCSITLYLTKGPEK